MRSVEATKNIRKKGGYGTDNDEYYARKPGVARGVIESSIREPTLDIQGVCFAADNYMATPTMRGR